MPHSTHAQVPACVGNCDGGASVTINELLLCVNAALDPRQLATCGSCDGDADGEVAVNELVRAVRNALGVHADIAGACVRPASAALAPCAAGTQLSLARCDNAASCLDDPAATTVFELGCAGHSSCIDSAGAFSLAVDDCRVFGATLLLTARVDAENGTDYRVIDIGPAGDGGGSVAAAEQLVNPAALLISPVSEAAVRVLEGGGLENFDAGGIQRVQAAVAAANQTTDFADLPAAAAAELALSMAAADPAVEATVASVMSPTRTATPTPTPRPTAVTLYLGSATGAPGDTVTVSVGLGTAGSPVVGTENELVLPAGVQPLAAGSAADCSVNPAIAKNGSSFTLQPPGCTPTADCARVKAIVFDLSNVDPIADGAELYTCRLRIAATAATGTAPIGCSDSYYSPPPPAPIPAPAAACIGGTVQIASGP